MASAKGNTRTAEAPQDRSASSIFHVVKPITLAQRIDDLGQLRQLLKQSQEAEKAMTAEIKALLAEAGKKEEKGAAYIATLGERVDVAIDAQLFLEATGEKGLACITVSTTKARELLSESDIRAISEPRPVPVLNVKALPHTGIGAAR